VKTEKNWAIAALWKGVARTWEPFLSASVGWGNGTSLNRRPLGYECKEECHFNELRGQGGASKY
jgi:hypothetical protein